jgi:hypothetical protein
MTASEPGSRAITPVYVADLLVDRGVLESHPLAEDMASPTPGPSTSIAWLTKSD